MGQGWDVTGVEHLPKRASDVVRPHSEQLADEMDRRRQVDQEKRDREEAQRIERERIEALSAEDQQRELAATQEAAQFEQQQRDFNEWINGLVQKGQLVRAVNPFTDKIDVVPPGGHTPPSLQPVVDLFHAWFELPAHERERWYAERSQLEKDQLSVFYQVRPPADIDEVPALQENQS
jgi:hypothetical protein